MEILSGSLSMRRATGEAWSPVCPNSSGAHQESRDVANPRGVAQNVNWCQKGIAVQFDLMTFLGLGVAVLVVLYFIRRSRGGATVEAPGRSGDDRKDVLRALQSMKKD